jgi:hypothetical protein
MIAGIHQLHYLPWLRYFQKIAKCDLFVVLDDIQYNKNGWQNRNKIKGSGGSMTITIPVFNKFQQTLDEVVIDNKTNWRKKHWQSLVTCYSKAPYFKEYAPELQKIYEKEWDRLNAVNYEMLKLFLSFLDIKTKLVRSSELDIPGMATERLIHMCKKLGADAYLSGAYAQEAYLDGEAFTKEGIRLDILEWQAPAYDQLFMVNGFIPDLSIVDLLFNEGDRSLDIIMRGKTA